LVRIILSEGNLNGVGCVHADAIDGVEARSLLGRDTNANDDKADRDNDDDDDDDVSLSMADEDGSNNRDRPNRAVSFGPNMVIDARRRGVEGDGVADCGEVKSSSEDDEDRRSGHGEPNDSVFQRPTVSSSPSADPAVASVVPGRQPSPALTSNPVPHPLGRHHGDAVLIGNGSVRGGLPLARPQSPQTPRRLRLMAADQPAFRRNPTTAATAPHTRPTPLETDC